MRTGTVPPPPTGGSYSPVAPFVQPGAPKARRQPAMLALGVALIGMSAAGFVYWNQQADTKSSVLVLARDVPYGQRIQDADLQVVQMTLASGVKAIGASDKSAVLQDVATTQLHAGSVLTAADIGTTPPVPAGTDVVSFAVDANLLPTGLAPGRQIMLIANKVQPVSELSPGSGAKPAPAAVYPADPPTYKATVVSIANNKLTLAVQQADAPIIEQIGADQHFGLALLPVGS